MRIRDEKIEIICNGKTVDTMHLNRGYQRLVYYAENEDIAAELAQGKTKKRAGIEFNKRAAQTFFNEAVSIINEIAKTDDAEAQRMIDGFLAQLAPADEDEVYLGAGVYCTKNAFDKSLEVIRATGGQPYSKQPGPVPDQQPGSPIILDAGEPVQLTGFDIEPLG